MTIHPAIQCLGPKERLDRVLELVKQARLDESIFEEAAQGDNDRDEAVERYSIACDQIVKELGLLIDTGITEQIMDCLSVIYGQ